jgi:uncharacterized membrane protein
MWWWNEYGAMPWAFGPFMMFAFMLLCMGAMWLMMRGMHGRSRGSGALAILQERFARGEISQAEYLERKEVLEA